MNTENQLLCVRDTMTGRQANNLWANSLAEAVRPWFAGMTSEQVTSAIDALADPKQRSAAAAFLGLEIVAAA